VGALTKHQDNHHPVLSASKVKLLFACSACAESYAQLRYLINHVQRSGHVHMVTNSDTGTAAPLKVERHEGFTTFAAAFAVLEKYCTDHQCEFKEHQQKGDKLPVQESPAFSQPLQATSKDRHFVVVCFRNGRHGSVELPPVGPPKKIHLSKLNAYGNPFVPRERILPGVALAHGCPSRLYFSIKAEAVTIDLEFVVSHSHNIGHT
jgi:hypothetical protein